MTGGIRRLLGVEKFLLLFVKHLAKNWKNMLYFLSLCSI